MHKVLTKAELVACLRQHELSFNAVLAKQFADAFFSTIIETLASGEKVKLHGLGTFRILNKKARPGRNLKTGVSVTIPSRTVVIFKPSIKLKSRLKTLRSSMHDSKQIRDCKV